MQCRKIQWVSHQLALLDAVSEMMEGAITEILVLISVAYFKSLSHDYSDEYVHTQKCWFP